MTTPRLNRALLDRLAVAGTPVEVPAPGALDLPERVLQFGTGAFLRGFVEYFIDEANRRGAFDGRVVAVATTASGSGRHRGLQEQGGLYTLVTREAPGEHAAQPRVIASLSRVLSATTEWDAVLAFARDPHLELIFSNTTEVGIVSDPGDTLHANPPRSFPGKLTQVLFERARAFDFDPTRGVAVIPCELIENNGDRLRQAVLALATRWKLDGRFASWLDAAVPFCNTLVDRIVPSLSDGPERRVLEDQLGYSDELLTLCEPYRLFAIQASRGVAGRLRFASGDPAIILSDDVTPYRLRKLHLLNGPHTIMAAIGLLAGCRTVDETMSGPVGNLIRRTMHEEIALYLDVDLAGNYADDVLERFTNPAIRHDLLDIMLQATTKMRVRVVPLILGYFWQGDALPVGLTLGFAALLRCLRGDIDAIAQRHGRSAPTDAGGPRIRDTWKSASDSTDFAGRVCADRTLWGESLDVLPGFTALVAELLSAMDSQGVQAVVENVNGGRFATARGGR